MIIQNDQESNCARDGPASVVFRALPGNVSPTLNFNEDQTCLVSGNGSAVTNVRMRSGKWYFEVLVEKASYKPR